jgi:hypothetical protein
MLLRGSSFASFIRNPVFPATTFVVRRDKKPLAKETVEAMYQFHASLMGSTNSFINPYELEVTPADFKEFSERYWVEEAAKLERERYSVQTSFIRRVLGGLIK